MSSFRLIKVFISYSHTDRGQVSAIGHFLPNQIFDIYLDRNRLHPGWMWEPLLLEMIRSADVFVLLVGSDTIQRDYVNKEVDAFLAKGASNVYRKFLPVLIDGCERIADRIAGYQALDLRGADALSRARLIGQAIHGAYYLPTGEMARSGHSSAHQPDRGDGEQLKQLWDTGQIGLHPSALAQIINMGIAPSGLSCTHRETDFFTMVQCTALAAVVCIACVIGACVKLPHIYGHFCTVIPPHGRLELGTKLFYWCPQCRGPICTRCLGIDEDYPCPPNHVISHRFLCQACGVSIQVVPVLQVDMEGVALECQRWARAGGPPEVGFA